MMCSHYYREKVSLRIDTENCNLKFELFDGYDWASTRHVIEVERKAMRRQLQRIRQVLATGQEAPQDVSELSGFAFNSVHLGLPEDTEFSSAAELASAIDISLKNLDNALEGQTEGWQELDDNRPPTATTVERKAGRSLNRASRAGIEFKLLGIHLQYLKPLFPNSSGFDSSLDLSVESLEILDNLPSSTWKTFLKTRPAERSAHRPLKTEPGASRCQIRWFGSSGNASSEASFKASFTVESTALIPLTLILYDSCIFCP
jgi:autophagy-related protein 2